MANGITHQSNLTISTFVDHHFQLGCVGAPLIIQHFDMGLGSPSAHDTNTFTQSLD